MKKLFLPAFAAALLFLTACNDSGGDGATNTAGDSTNVSKEDKEERNKKTALESMEAMNAHNLDGILKDATPDAVDYGEGSMPPVKGVDSIKAGLKMFLDAFPDYKGENFNAVADGDYVYVSADWTGTFKNDMMGMKATGKSFKVKDVDIFRFNDDGKMVEHRAILPWSVSMQQVGAQQPK